MNLLEAIEAGAQRVQGRCKFSFVKRNDVPTDLDTYYACALGAAYLGCHPDAKLDELVNNWGPIREWVGEKLHPDHLVAVYTINDLDVSGRGWGEVLSRLRDRPFAQDEVCNDTGETT